MEKKVYFAGRKIFPIGLGAMATDEYKPKASEEEAIEFFRYAAKRGVELMDTADVYGLGRNEMLIGKALTAEQKQKIIIATKAGCTRPFGTGWRTDGRPEHIKEAIKGSLERLGVKQIFLYQLHAPDPKVPIKETLRAFKELQEQGLFKCIGVSNFNLEQLKEAQKTVEVVSVQNHYNLANKKDEEELLPYLTDNNIAYLPYFPLGSGRLLNERRVIEIAGKAVVTPSQLALSWILAKWPTAIPIPGTRNKQHLDENMKSADAEMDEKLINELDSLY